MFRDTKIDKNINRFPKEKIGDFMPVARQMTLYALEMMKGTGPNRLDKFDLNSVYPNLSDINLKTIDYAIKAIDLPIKGSEISINDLDLKAMRNQSSMTEDNLRDMNPYQQGLARLLMQLEPEFASGSREGRPNYAGIILLRRLGEVGFNGWKPREWRENIELLKQGGSYDEDNELNSLTPLVEWIYAEGREDNLKGNGVSTFILDLVRLTYQTPR